MRYTFTTLLLLNAILAFPAAVAQGSGDAAESLGWQLGVQAYSFRSLTFFETIERVEALGLHFIEAYPGQRLSKDHANLTMNHKLSPEVQAEIRNKLAKHDVKLVNFGVVSLPNDEKHCRAVFDFAKAMGIETLVSEPPLDAMPLIDRLCEEYAIDMAIHNHPAPSAYWHPDRVWNAIEGRGDRIGACIDTSHWQRSGIDVLAQLKRFEGRIVCFHLGQVDAEARESFLDARMKSANPDKEYGMVPAIQQVPNVPFGEGAGDMKAWLREIERQGFRGVFSIEAFYQYAPSVAQERMKSCVKFFNQAAEELLRRR